MNRLERQRREAGISTEKVNKMKSEIYEAMRKNGVTIIEAKVIIAELGRIISEAEKRSPNTRLSEISRPQEGINGSGGAPGPRHPIPCPPKAHFTKEDLKRAEEMMRYAIAKNPETDHIEIFPMNGKGYIELHGEEDIKFFTEFFTDQLMDSFRKE